MVVVVGGVDVASRGLRLLLGATTRGVAERGRGGAMSHHLTSLVCLYVWTHACMCVQYSPRRCRRAAPLLDERGDKRRRCGTGSACQWKPRVTAERQRVTLCFVPAVAAAQRHLRRAKSASFSPLLCYFFFWLQRASLVPRRAYRQLKSARRVYR